MSNSRLTSNALERAIPHSFCDLSAISGVTAGCDRLIQCDGIQQYGIVECADEVVHLNCFLITILV